MNRETLESFGKALSHQRARLFKEVTDTEADLAFIAEDREAEFVERAQEENAAAVLARLDKVAKHEIDEIDAALGRIAAGRFGDCLTCGDAIAVERLRVLPATRVCLTCARAQEAGAIAGGVTAALPQIKK